MRIWNNIYVIKEHLEIRRLSFACRHYTTIHEASVSMVVKTSKFLHSKLTFDKNFKQFFDSCILVKYNLGNSI